ncbi:MAG: hypothetical protein AB7I13_11040 [Vicinamibacterales bacterium]
MDRRTLFTFSGPVSLPGITLPAGTYLFRLPSPGTSNQVVQVLNGEATRDFGLFHTIPAERLDVPATPEIRFLETAEGMPTAIKTWWYPERRTGFEFIYPREQAMRLAKGAKEPVLTTRAQTTRVEDTDTDDLERVDATGAAAEIETRTSASAATGRAHQGRLAADTIRIPEVTAPSTQPRTVARAEGQSARNDSRGDAAAEGRRTQLPQTAGTLPIFGLVGALALMGAASIRLFVR